MKWSYCLQLFIFIPIVVTSMCGLITKDFSFLPVTFMLLGCTFLLIGMRAWQRAKRSTISILSFGTAIFLFVIVGQSFFD
ncbi:MULTISPECIES: DUF3953 domain-containing protein [Lysinibacillus]|uniref:DUF3953 domain-containing protein n=1 Tax=Lysinibacillus fusiformis TaxID=28031 RepID=A0A2I0UZG4_9BACI|nr:MULTISPECIES: DUF3953 domain-containing protein [Lysinibacillus]KUF32641.1 hypothetical protein AK833_13555 [Lysinibacillus sp. F5]PKU51352.1 DUF3953 domain-containing protein [Lysinibacillus fusiformis]